MADFTKTVSNTLDLFGESPSSLWGFFTWGVDKWGDGSKDLAVDIVKLIDNSQVISDAISLSSIKVVANNLTTESETTSETLSDGSGWNYIFTKPTTDAENRNITSFTSVAPASNAWASASVTTTVWS